MGTEAAATALTTLPLSTKILTTVVPIFVYVEKIDDRWESSELGSELDSVDVSDSVVPNGAARARVCSSGVSGISSLMMHSTSPRAPSKAVACSGSAS